MWLKNVAFALLICPLLTACFSKPFQPPTADADLWKNPAPVTRMWLRPCWRVVKRMAPALIPRPASKRWPSDLYV